MNIAQWVQSVLREIFSFKNGEGGSAIRIKKSLHKNKKRYWYGLHLTARERKHIREFINKDPDLKGYVILKSVKRNPTARKLKKAA